MKRKTVSDKKITVDRLQGPALSESHPDNILALIHVFSNLIGRAFYSQVETKHKISIIQWRIFITLMNHPGATAVHIGESWALRAMSVGRAIQELEERGLIVRRPHLRDRRSHALYLTPKGKKMYEKVVPDANARYHDIVDCLPPRDRSHLAQALVKLVRNASRLVS
jgi:DNA-binding MarR family transcriptional regulator